MKMKSILMAASLLAMCAVSAHAERLFIMPDGSMDSMPHRGMQVYEPPHTKYQATLDISTEDPARGTGALRVECEDGVYVSISFPMTTTRDTGRASVYLRGDLVDADEVTIGVQSFTMDGGFKSVSLIPVIDAKARIGADWQHFTFDLKRNPDATHWQLSFILRGPGVLWIDHLEEVTD